MIIIIESMTGFYLTSYSFLPVVTRIGLLCGGVDGNCHLVGPVSQSDKRKVHGGKNSATTSDRVSRSDAHRGTFRIY